MTTIVITGATSGLGRLAAVELARRGARLVLPARSPQKAAETERLVRTAAPGANTRVYLADLSRVDEIRGVARAIREDHPSIDVLVNNAGLHAFTPRATADGFPEMVAVNYFAAWILTTELLPALTAASEARVVTVASEASRRHGRLSLPRDLTAVDDFTARGSSEHYGKTKLLDIMFTMELARRVEGTSVSAMCLDPGFNVTGLGRELRAAQMIERVLKSLHVGDPARGADLIVRLASDPLFAHANGQYWTVRGPKRIEPVAAANDIELQKRLWLETEALLQG